MLAKPNNAKKSVSTIGKSLFSRDFSRLSQKESLLTG